MPTSQIAHLAAVLVSVAILTAPPSATTQAEQPTRATQLRPAAWAAPVAVAGVPNLHRVAPNFYRSAQPDAGGFKALAKDPGVKTVVSLRAFNSDEPLAEGTGIKLVRIKIHTWNIETEDVVKALAAIHRAQAVGPVLLHCQHGADRTGLITALYRVLYEGWTKDAALAEMQNGKFGYHAVWGNIPRYLRKIDRVAMRQMVDKAEN
jgi:protein tyrosine phosphatase (PTP) superfamily phosphohydrolase (DUF442 family)